jgi:hypothetical protein
MAVEYPAFRGKDTGFRGRLQGQASDFRLQTSGKEASRMLHYLPEA